MRLDLYLKMTRLVPRRSVAAELCREGNVELNGDAAKAARPVAEGDRIVLQFPGRRLSVEVVAVPSGRNLSKDKARKCYRVLGDERFDIWGQPLKSRE